MILPGDTSKITIPLLPTSLKRPRLLKLLETNKEKRVIFILGQAAQGKTTLAASFAKVSTLQTAWMSLDGTESDPVNLFYLMTHSLQHIFREIDFSSFISFPSGMSSGMSENAFHDWSRHLFELIPVPVQIVMDGLDRLLTAVTTPNGRETWVAGSTQTISWSYTGSPGSYVKIELLKGGVLNLVISSSSSIGSGGSGSYAWIISTS